MWVDDNVLVIAFSDDGPSTVIMVTAHGVEFEATGRHESGPPSQGTYVAVEGERVYRSPIDCPIGLS